MGYSSDSSAVFDSFYQIWSKNKIVRLKFPKKFIFIISEIFSFFLILWDESLEIHEIFLDSWNILRFMKYSERAKKRKFSISTQAKKNKETINLILKIKSHKSLKQKHFIKSSSTRSVKMTANK